MNQGVCEAVLRFKKYINKSLILITSLLLCYTSATNATTTSDSKSQSATHSAIHHNTKSHSKTAHQQHNAKKKLSNKKQPSHTPTLKSHPVKNTYASHAHPHAKLNKTKAAHRPIHKNNQKKQNRINVRHQNGHHHQLVNSHSNQNSQHVLNSQSHIVQHQQNATQRSNAHTAFGSADRHGSLAFNTLSPSETTGERLVSFVHEVVGSLRYTRYAYGAGVFDSKYGVYKLDCSHYVDNILHRADPMAYASLEAGTGAQMPNSANYYDFFTRLSDHLRYDWDKVDNARELQPGDVLVFRFRNPYGVQEGGHVMLVMDKPVIDNDALLVRVSDSAAAGHSDDTRAAHNSGVGIGTLLLKVDSYTGQPSAYAWEFNSPWKSSVDIAMARPSSLG